MQHTEIVIQAGALPGQPGTFLVAENAPLSVNPTVPNPVEREFDSSKIGPFGWIGIAFCIIIVVCAGISIYNAARKDHVKKLVDTNLPEKPV